MGGWDFAKLGEICDFKGGSQPPKSNFIYEPRDGYIRFLQIRDFGSDKNHTYIPISKNNNICREDDIMIGRYGASVGKILTGKTGAYNVALMKATPNSKIISREWLFHYLTSQLFQTSLMSVATRSAQDGFSKDDIYNFQVPLPPLPVQKAIVAKLDAAFASIEQAIAAAEKNAENAKQLFQSYLSDVFERADEGWVDKHLNDVAVEFGRGKSKHRPRNDPALYGGNYPFLQTGDVRNAGKFVTEYSQTYNENGLKQSKLWPKGTLCITIAANIAEVSILGLDACFPDSIIGLVVDAKQADIEFIYYSLLFAQKILKAKGKGSAQDNINQGTFESMMFKFPDLNTQKIVVENLHAIAVVLEELNTMYSTKNELLTQLKQSLLQQAFNGQLVDA